MSGVRVVAITYHSEAVLPEFLDSLAKSTTQPLEVVLADNAFADAGTEAVAQPYDRVRVLDTGGNVGYGRGANAGAAGADQEWLVVANPDVVWDPGSLDELLDAALRWPSGGAFGPAIRTSEGALYPSARALPSLGRGIGHALAGWWWPSNPWTAAYRRERELPMEGPVGWLSGSCLLLRRAAFEAVGRFDPSYFMYFEDLDLCERLGRAGWESVYVPSAQITHSGAHSTSRNSVRMLAEHHRSAYRYLSRRYAGPHLLALRLALRAGLTGRYLLARSLRSVGEGAKPTRSADLLEQVPTRRAGRARLRRVDRPGPKG